MTRKFKDNPKHISANSENTKENYELADAKKFVNLSIIAFLGTYSPSEEAAREEYVFKTDWIKSLVIKYFLNYPLRLDDLMKEGESAWARLTAILKEVQDYEVVVYFSIGLIYLFHGLVREAFEYFEQFIKNSKKISHDILDSVIDFLWLLNLLFSVMIDSEYLFDRYDEYTDKLKKLYRSTIKNKDKIFSPSLEKQKKKKPARNTYSELLDVIEGGMTLFTVFKAVPLMALVLALIPSEKKTLEQFFTAIRKDIENAFKETFSTGVEHGVSTLHMNLLLKSFDTFFEEASSIYTIRSKLIKQGVFEKDINSLSDSEYDEVFDFLEREADFIFSILTAVKLEFLLPHFTEIEYARDALEDHLYFAGAPEEYPHMPLILLGPLYAKKYPRNEIINFLAGVYYFYRGNLKLAEDYLEIAYKRNYTHPDIYKFLIRVYILRKKRTKKARTKISQLLDRLFTKAEFSEDLEFAIGAKLAMGSSPEDLMETLEKIKHLDFKEGMINQFYNALKNKDSKKISKLKKHFIQAFYKIKPIL